MKKGYSIVITPDDSTSSRHYFLTRKSIILISVLVIVIVVVAVVAALNYTNVSVKAMEVDMLRRRNAQLEQEFAKIEEIRENLRIAEADNRKIKVMLGIEKTPEMVEPAIREDRFVTEQSGSCGEDLSHE